MGSNPGLPEAILHGVSLTSTILLVADRGGSYGMNANDFRHFYDYHFTENRKIWDTYITSLSQEQLTQNVGYSHGSV